jgi:tyrosinase
MAGLRKDIARLNGPWANEVIWYARAVRELRQRNLSQRSSWAYLAALHGIDPQGWINQAIIPSNTAAPSQDEMRLMFNQCQHAGWFFLPWHRGYLAAFESILAAWIGSQGGPDDWALPYWNYLGNTAASPRDIPVEFLGATMPDGSPNPLSDARRGPSTVLGPVPWLPNDITLDAQTGETEYTSEPGTLGYGGPISGFSQQGNAFGAVESNPHNFVHVMIGGDTTQTPQGWMFDPNFAALDPIFWLHHCNIDRLWTAWMARPGNNQETSKPWRNGPFPRQFTMPDAAGSLDVFIPEDTLPGGRLEPKYDDVVNGTGITPPSQGVSMASGSSRSPGPSSLVAANDASLSVAAAPVQSRLTFAPRGSHTGLAASVARTERYYLNVEGVKGAAASGVLTVRIFLPGADENLPPREATKTLVFFGLANATTTDGPHAGNGLSATVEITDITKNLLDRAGGTLGTLDVQLSQPQGSDTPISVDRISIYSRRIR